MHCKGFFCLTILGASTAQTISSRAHYARLHRRDIDNLVHFNAEQSEYAGLSPLALATLPVIKSSIKHGTEGVNALNAALEAITEQNVKTQLATANNLLVKLNGEVVADMKKLKSSGAIAIGEILGLLQESGRNELIQTVMGLFTALNHTAVDFVNKRDIIKNAGAADIIAPGIKGIRQGLVDIAGVVPSQVPSIAKGALNGIISSVAAKFGGGGATGGTSTPAPAPEPAPKGKGGKGKGGSGGGASSSAGGVTIDTIFGGESLEAMGKFLDTTADQIISWLKGTSNSIIPAGALESAGLSKGTLESFGVTGGALEALGVGAKKGP